MQHSEGFILDMSLEKLLLLAIYSLLVTCVRGPDSRNTNTQSCQRQLIVITQQWKLQTPGVWADFNTAPQFLIGRQLGKQRNNHN